jgi:hypothetical protein
MVIYPKSVVGSSWQLRLHFLTETDNQHPTIKVWEKQILHRLLATGLQRRGCA